MSIYTIYIRTYEQNHTYVDIYIHVRLRGDLGFPSPTIPQKLPSGISVKIRQEKLSHIILSSCLLSSRSLNRTYHHREHIQEGKCESFYSDSYAI